MKTNQFNIETYNYNLPKELIAQEPYQKRDNARLLVVNGLIDDHFYTLTNYIDKDDVIVINKTKVLKFKLYATKESGSKVEITILSENRIEKQNQIKCRIKALKPRINNKYILKSNVCTITKAQKDDIFTLEFYKNNNLMTFKEVYDYCQEHGFYPLPNYIKEQKKDEKYQEKYQTVFAENEGSIAAPTASLHFTKEQIQKLKAKGVIFAELTLHVSYSTFKPIRINDIREHKLDPEYIEIDEKNANIINNAKANVIAVGTTVLKSLESLTNDKGIVEPKSIQSNLFIYPGYKFKSKANKLITNFHLPKSSLILLTSAFASWSTVKEAYEHAVKKKYNFFSFGDAMILGQE